MEGAIVRMTSLFVDLGWFGRIIHLVKIKKPPNPIP